LENVQNVPTFAKHPVPDLNLAAPELWPQPPDRLPAILLSWRGYTTCELATMASDDGVGPRKRRRIGPPGTDPYILRSLFDNVPLATEDSSDVYITCVEYWGKLYQRGSRPWRHIPLLTRIL